MTAAGHRIFHSVDRKKSSSKEPLKGGGGYTGYCGRQYAKKKPVDARRARKKYLDARRLQMSLLDPYQMEYLRKSFPDYENHYLSITNEHANAKFVGVTKSLLWLTKKVPLGHERGRF